MTEHKSSTWNDKAGNQFTETANKEIVTVKTPDGRIGQGWTEEIALKNAVITIAVVKTQSGHQVQSTIKVNCDPEKTLYGKTYKYEKSAVKEAIKWAKDQEDYLQEKGF